MKTNLKFALALAVGLSGALGSAAFAEDFSLMLGDPAGQHVALMFAADKASDKAVVVTTRLAGVAGSRVSLSIDKAKDNIINHILADQECKFVDNASTCEFAIPGGTNEYARIVDAFKKGLTVHVEVETAGSMEMQNDISLKGFTKNFNKL